MSANYDQSNQNAKGNEIVQLVSFNIGDEEFGVDILRVQEINRMVEITRVPNSPEYVEGVINLRGKVIPIIQMRKRMNMDAKPLDKDTRIVVVEIDKKVIGFIVDGVNEVLRIDKTVTEAPPAMVSGIDSDFITSIAKLEDRLLILLDLEKILSTNEVDDLKKLG
jgi:purine-binding chemotaxis protein CheW